MQVDLKGHSDLLDRRYNESYRKKWLHSRAIYRKVTLSTRFAVLNALIYFGNHKHPYVWPSLAKLSKIARLSVKTIKRSLSDLEKVGVIKRIPDDLHNYPTVMWMLNYDLMDNADYQKLVAELEQDWKEKGYDFLNNIPPHNESQKLSYLDTLGDSENVLN